MELPELIMRDKVEKAVGLLQTFAPLADRDGGLSLRFSGGKDSIVIKHLAVKSGVPFKSYYSMTTIDPPEVVRFIKEHHPDVHIVRPKVPFFHRLEAKGPPTRLVRWCCAEYKENRHDFQWSVVGVRAAESPRRKANWSLVTRFQDRRTVLCPILHWSDEDVWAYIKSNNLPYPSLYDEGFTRLGCIGCPLGGAKSQRREFERWPRYAALWYRGIKRYWESHHGKLSTRGPRKGQPYYSDCVAETAHDYFRWWIERPSGKDEDKQCIMGMF